jgi:rhamnosyltransferase
MRKPKVAVLMATFNGHKWISQQIKSIFNQKDVLIELFIRDDRSTDKTKEIIIKLKKKYNINYSLNKNKTRSASSNFLNLILKTKLKDFDFFSFSDQDDIWSPEKIKRAIEMISITKSKAYSSMLKIKVRNKSVLWKKSYKQKEFDFLFEGVTGCTIVLSRSPFAQIKNFLKKKKNTIEKIFMYDWFIYYFLRSRKIPWFIDPKSYINYRQHTNNSFGANLGIGLNKLQLNSLIKRLKIIYTGQYISATLYYAKILNFKNNIIASLENFNFFDRIKLMLQTKKLRRSFIDSFFLKLIFLTVKK